MSAYEVIFTIVLLIGAYGCHYQSKVIQKLQNDIRHLRKWAKASDEYFKGLTKAHEMLARAHDAQDKFCKNLGTAVLSNQNSLTALTEVSHYLAGEVDKLNEAYATLTAAIMEEEPKEETPQAEVLDVSPVTHLSTRRTQT